MIETLPSLCLLMLRCGVKKEVEFYYDYGSPASHLAFYRLLQFQEKYGLEIKYRPILLGGLFKTIGNHPPGGVPAKGKYLFKDFLRYANRYGVRFNFNPYFPVNTLGLMRAAVALVDDAQALHTLNKACFDAMWVAQKNMSDPKTIGSVLSKTDLDLQHLMAAIQNSEIKENLKQRTQEAVDRGIFGAPTCFFRKQMYWGQDRLFFIEEQLSSE